MCPKYNREEAILIKDFKKEIYVHSDMYSYGVSNRMLVIDQHSRPGASHLLRTLYTRTQIDKMNSDFESSGLTKVDKNHWFNSIYSTKIFNVSSDIKRSNIIDWIYDCLTFKNRHLFTLSVWIFDKMCSSHTNIISDDEYISLAAASIIIVDNVLQYGVFSLNYIAMKTASFYLNKKVDSCIIINCIKKYVDFIFQELKYNTYVRTFDYYLRCRKESVDYTIVKKMCKNGENMGLSVVKQIELYDSLNDY
jgi:hypothetical protein